ncbi:MAG: hypothetical protein AB1815_02980 [Bacillota bacterium]
MYDVNEHGPTLDFRDDYDEVDFIPDDDRYMYENEGIKPVIIAAICGALLACGLRNKSVIKSIRRATTGINPWKAAGLMDLMLSREVNRY